MKSSIFRRLVLAGLLFFALATQAEHYSVPLLVPAGTSSEPQGVLRILNGTGESGTVEIYAIDDAGTRVGPATFTLNASAAVQFTATDLQSGNATVGLTGGIDTDVGDARLAIETDLQIVPLAFVRAADGTVSAMHGTVRGASVGGSVGYTYEVPIFNPASDVTGTTFRRLRYLTGSNRFTLNAQTGERFTETAEIDGVSTTYMGSYDYAGIGPDAGRLTLSYDDGDVCAANLYFSTHTAGWFASHCTGSEYPAGGDLAGRELVR